MARRKVEKNIAYDDERKLYYVYLTYGKDAAGKYRREAKTASSKREAQQILRRHNKAKEAGIAVMPAKNTLVAAVEAFIDYKALDLAKTTIYGYKHIFENHIKSYFKDMPIQAVTLQHLQDYRVAKTKELSANTIGKHFALLHSVFKDAYRKQLISRNPVDLLDPIKKETKKKICLNAAEIAALCGSVKGTKLEVPVILAVYLGLRRGEICGLRWIDIDFGQGLLHVRNTRTKAGGTVIEKEPKTEKSERTLWMPEEVVETLQRALGEKREVQRKHKRYIDTGYVVTKQDGSAFSVNYISESFLNRLRKQGLPTCRFHDLRHSFASIANSAGIPMTEISATMGHSNLSTTYTVYTHELTSSREIAVNAVAQEIQKAQASAEAC